MASADLDPDSDPSPASPKLSLQDTVLKLETGHFDDIGRELCESYLNGAITHITINKSILKNEKTE